MEILKLISQFTVTHLEDPKKKKKKCPVCKCVRNKKECVKRRKSCLQRRAQIKMCERLCAGKSLSRCKGNVSCARPLFKICTKPCRKLNSG